MRVCLKCNESHSSSSIECPACGSSVEVMNGFRAYAPELAHAGGGFKSTHFADLAAMEDRNFWFRSRNRLILWAVEKYCSGFQSFLEIGCGTGYVMSGLARAYSDASLHGSEIFVEGLGFAANRLPSVDLMQMDARKIPFRSEFDVIGAFDVLEHIEEDETVLAQVHEALKPDGMLLLSVPQHEWLWSAVDDFSCHARRYVASDLHRKIKAAGFEIVRSTSFVTVLLPAMAVSRLLRKNESIEDVDVTTELKINPVLNSVFYQLLSAELAVIKTGIDFPVGGSRLVIASKA